MSVYAQIDGGEQRQIASNTGWGDACRWIDTLDVDEAGELIHLREHGWTDEASIAAEQLHRELDIGEVAPDVAAVCADLLIVLESAAAGDVVCITDGMGSGGDA